MRNYFRWMIVPTSFVLLFGYVAAFGVPSQKMISGCVNKQTGVLRIVAKCSANETKLTFAQQGEKGIPGVVGIDGVTGLPGKDGAQGLDGLDGINGRDGKDGVDGINGRDGSPGIAGQRGVTGLSGKDGSEVEVYYAYVKSQDFIVTGTSKKVIVLRLSALKIPLSVSTSTFRATANINVYFQGLNKNGWCTWQGSDWETTTSHYGNIWYFSSAWATSNFSTVTASANIDGLVPVSTSSDIFLTCTFYGNASISSGWVSAQKVTGNFQGTIGG